MFHCFNIFKHISILVLFFIIFTSYFSFLLDFENNCPRGGVLAQFFCPRGGFFALSLLSGGREFALSKNFPLGGGGEVRVRLGID